MAEQKAPKMVIDQTVAEESLAPAGATHAQEAHDVHETANQVEASTAEATPVAAASAEEASALGAMRSLPGLVTRTFPGHERAVYGALAGLALALLVFAIGVWRALVIALFVVVGALIGQCLDGDTRILKALRRLLSDNNN